jgi:hypothetical protein
VSDPDRTDEWNALMATAEFWDQAMRVSRVISRCGLRVHHTPFWIFRRVRQLLSEGDEEQAVSTLRDELAERS